MYYDEAELFEDNLCINAELVVEDDFDQCLEWISNEFPDTLACPFCSKKLLHLFDQDPLISSKNLEYDGEYSSLKICNYCVYWQWYYQDPLLQNSFGCPDHFVHAGISKVRNYEKEFPTGCYEEIAVALRRNPKLWHTINPYEFERLVAAVFKANHADCEVFHVGCADDGGVDVVFVDDANKQWLIQVKRRENPSAGEGVGTLRNLLGTMILNDSSYGMVVSTADHFTFRANEAVGRALSVGKTLRLIDRGKIDRMIGGLLPDRPWLNFIEHRSPELATVFSGMYDSVAVNVAIKHKKDSKEQEGQLDLFPDGMRR